MNIQDYTRRPIEYNNIDGVGELGIGFMAAAFAAWMWILIVSPDDAIWHRWYMFVAFIATLSLVLHYGPKAIKKRLTYPRTGYVAYRRRFYVWAMVAASVLAALFVFLLSRGHVNYAALVGLAVVPGYVYRVVRMDQWKWVVAVALAAGSLAIASAPQWLRVASGMDPSELGGSIVLTLFFYGGVFLVSGAISFYLYLRRTQPPALEAE